MKDLRLPLVVMLALLSMLVLLGCQQSEPLPASTSTPLPTPTPEPMPTATATPLPTPTPKPPPTAPKPTATSIPLPTPTPTPTPRPTPTPTPTPRPTAYVPHEWYEGQVFGIGIPSYAYTLNQENCSEESPPECVVHFVKIAREPGRRLPIFIPYGYIVDLGDGEYFDNCSPNRCWLVPLPKELQDTGMWQQPYVPEPTATLVPEPTATLVPEPTDTLEFIPDEVTQPWGDSTATRLGYIGDWVIMTVGRSQHLGYNYARSVRNPFDAPQQYTCFNYPDERGNVPRVNLTMPYPVVFTRGPGEREVPGKSYYLGRRPRSSCVLENLGIAPRPLVP